MKKREIVLAIVFATGIAGALWSYNDYISTVTKNIGLTTSIVLRLSETSTLSARATLMNAKMARRNRAAIEKLQVDLAKARQEMYVGR